MTYFNIVHHYGIEKFCRKARECGAYGLIVPDMPVDEEPAEGFLKACRKYGLMAIQVISPLTPEKRLKKITKVANGFVYCVSRYGTTGSASKLNPRLSAYLKKVRRHIKLPLAVGFGIANRAQIKAVHEHAEIAVIGSALMGKNAEEVKSFLKTSV
jgi:tryptophan synthase alpha subunit